MATKRQREMKLVSDILHEFLNTVEKSDKLMPNGEISIVCKHTRKHVMTENEYKSVILEKYKIDMSS